MLTRWCSPSSCGSKGIRHVLRFLDIWGAAYDRNASHWKLVCYEDLAADPEVVFGDILRFWGVSSVDNDALRFAVNESRFDKLQAKERARGEASVDKLRIRRGRVGGYRAEVGWANRFFLACIIQRDIQHLFQRYAPTGRLRALCGLAIDAHRLRTGDPSRE